MTAATSEAPPASTSATGTASGPARGPRSPRPLRVLYGIHPILEALAAGHVPERAWTIPQGNPRLAEATGRLRAARVPVHVEDRERLDRRAGCPDHQGLVALAPPLCNASLTGLVKDRPEDPLCVLVLDGVQDPQNLGAAYRIADATGVDLVMVPAHRSASPQLGSVAKASAGAVEHVRTVVVGELARALGELAEKGFTIALLEAGAHPAPWDTVLTGRVALVAGAEHRGLSGPSRRAGTLSIAIPMVGKVNSLNVAAAAGIVLAERRRQLAGRS